MIITGLLDLVYAIGQVLLVIPPVHFDDRMHYAAQYFGSYLYPWWAVLPKAQIQVIFNVFVVVILPLTLLRIGLFVYGLFRGHQFKI